MEEKTPIEKHKKAPKPVFFSAALVIFVLTLSAADSVGFVPNYIDGTAPTKVALSELPMLGNEKKGETILPERISIPAINLDLPIQNPATTDMELLEIALQNGPVRYVDSAKLNEAGNMLVFAHSSHLPVVRNQMYKAFNRIPELKAGDSITVSGGGKNFLYSVKSIRQADADEAIIDLSTTNGTRLTLSTCDTLTSKSSRLIVEADLVGEF